MVEYQLRNRGIQNEAVLTAMSKVPRHQFVSLSWRDFAYSDRLLPIDHYINVVLCIRQFSFLLQFI